MRFWREVVARGLIALALTAGLATAASSQTIVDVMNGAAPWWVLRGTVPASLDFDFANGRYYQAGTAAGQSPGNLITTSRASVAYEDDLSGNWIQFPSNTLRVTNKGALIEEARTNGIRNNSMQGGAAPSTLPINWALGATLGGITPTYAYGTENGINYIDITWNGTTSSAALAVIQFETANSIAATNGQTLSNSMFITNPAGSLTNITSIGTRFQTKTAGGAALTNYGVNITPSNQALGVSRRSFAGTIFDATSAFAQPYIIITSSGTGLAVNLTLRIGWPQLELGAPATSPIVTTNAAVTRAGDNDNDKQQISNAQTIVVSGVTENGIGANNQIIWQWDDGSESNRISLFRNTSRVVQALVTSGGVQQALLSLGTVADATAFKAAFAWGASDFAGLINGGSLQTSGSGSVPTGLTVQRLAVDSAGANQGDIYMKRQTIFSARQPNAKLQSFVQ